VKYALFIYETPAAFANRSDAEQERYWAAWRAWGVALNEAGVMRGGNALQPPATATVVRNVGDRRQVQDGPFADSKEQLGGFTLIEAPTLDAALAWAAKAPVVAMGGAIEVRPVLENDTCQDVRATAEARDANEAVGAGR
jgi:hypothetical protein